MKERWTTAMALSLTLGCPNTHAVFDTGSLDASRSDAPLPDAGADAGPSCRSVPLTLSTTDTADLLFVIDNSGSMSEEQAALVAELPAMVRRLVTGDRDGDGVADFVPIGSLHLGVVTTDLGRGDQDDVPTCDRPLGDDGILRTSVRTGAGLPGGCVAGERFAPADFAFGIGGDLAAFSSRFGCVASLGVGGCGFEQQLEVTLKALSPGEPQSWTRAGYTPPRFFDPATGRANARPGHGTGENSWFLRSNSVLGVFILTDEEDCSLSDYRLIGQLPGTPGPFPEPYNIRCFRHSDPAEGVVRPVQRYIDGLIGLRQTPGRLVVGGVMGVPPSTDEAASRGDYAAVLADPGMILRPNPEDDNVETSCVAPGGRGVAYPPVRIVQTLAGLSRQGVATAVSSICNPSFTSGTNRFIDQMGAATLGSCAPAPEARCAMEETLPPGMRCSSLPGRTLARMSGGSEICTIARVAGAGDGWSFDGASANVTVVCGASRGVYSLSGRAAEIAGATYELNCCGT